MRWESTQVRTAERFSERTRTVRAMGRSTLSMAPVHRASSGSTSMSSAANGSAFSLSPVPAASSDLIVMRLFGTVDPDRRRDSISPSSSRTFARA